jgi:hypothetical protein
MDQATMMARLRELQNLKPGDSFPVWMHGHNSWGPPVSALCGAAADEIERLRALSSDPDVAAEEARYEARLKALEARSEMLCAEIDRLQRVAGAVTTGESFGEMRERSNRS